ncbi:hypothetical protein KUL25_02440 [Rhodobacteraceae bacterium N5(2021)]|uniref:Uncharacterized protein n=1 Tax=Gymnodinialimonas phycosphaerae TaxID=2841589 RepID=A0A975TW63_9RHOB|nr:hypothetical protein [Gymnodinialimonas phycosphaerae]MBY4891620.1 hypothetical protein [Gymnodinialimonas phycosphaerae]
MKKIAIIAATTLSMAASLAAPAFAQSASTAFAIAHFNQSADSASDVVALPNGANTTQVSTRGMTPLAEAFALFNEYADGTGDLRGLNGATVVNGTPAYGADIFERLRAADRENN